MRLSRRAGAAFGVLSFLVLSSCVDSNVVAPDADSSAPSMAVMDGSTFGSDDFYFLPPLAQGSPSISGTFNPNLSPAMRVCELEGDPGVDGNNVPLSECVQRTPVAYFGPGSAQPGTNQYQLSWDTDGPETGRFNTNRFYRLEILVGSTVMGWLDLDPQNPQGPGQSSADAYAFRVGETIPVKFFLSTDVLCDPSAFVTECITGAVVDQTGADLALDQAGNKLGLTIFQGTLPSEANGSIIVTIERIDPAAYLLATGSECVPGLNGVGGFDAPQFGDCFRVTTDPVLTQPLTGPALVSICIDPSELNGLNLPEDQENQLTMVRYNDVANEWEGLPDTAGDCPITTASLMRVPESGFMKYAALGINAVAGFLGPQPVAARDLNLGGLTSSFSRFRYALPGQMIPTAGDGTVIGAADDNTITATVSVVDFDNVPVENAVVHFSTTDGTINGVTATTADVVSDALGNATVQWTVDRSVTPSLNKVLTAQALGLFAGAVPEHDANYVFTAQSVTVNAEIVGPPAALARDPEGNIDDAVAGEPQTISVTVTDANGNTIAGVEVGWTCTGDCTIPATSTTDANGVATVAWTPRSAGSQASVATVGTVDPATFTATVAPAAAASLSPTQSATSAPIGSPVSLGITVTDAFGNPRSGDAVTWTVASGAGSFTGASASTATNGTATATWTLGATPGANSATVSAAGLSHTFNADGVCFAGWGTATINGSFGAGEWACASSESFTANLSGGSTDAVMYWMNDASNLYLAVQVRRSSLDNTNSVRFDFNNDAVGPAAAGDDAIGFDGKSFTFLDEYLTAKCANNNQSGCGNTDQSQNGSGMVANDGTWTTYELSHPLVGDGNGQDFTRTAGQALSFFLTLRQGNGAQGNTQYPGFRNYRTITIRGLGN